MNARGTGRTTRMLLRAVLFFLDGNNVLITAWKQSYAKDLMYKCVIVLQSLSVNVIMKDNTFEFNGREMIFDSHENISKYQWRSDISVFSDHYYQL